MYLNHRERHRIKHISWLRAAVLGANDGIISTASLLMGVTAAHATHSGIIIAGIVALIAGAMSMAAGEFISVSSQADTEKSDLAREKHELETNIDSETEELTYIYIERGLERSLAEEVAKQLMAHDALGAHARDELGITELFSARPFQAACFSAGSFAVGAALPVVVTCVTQIYYLIPTLFFTAILFLATLGGIAAKVGGAKIHVGALRVTVWGTLAMLVSAGIGFFVGVAI